MKEEERIERRMAAYAGRDYAKPRRVVVEKFDFIDLDGKLLPEIMDDLAAFAQRVDGLDLEYEFERNWGDESSKARIVASRWETAGEIAARVMRYRIEAEAYLANRRAEYEKHEARILRPLNPSEG